MIVFNCFPGMVSSWFVRPRMQLPDLIRECFQQQCAEFRLSAQWYMQVFGLSHTLSSTSVLHLCFLAFLTPFFLLTQVSKY